MAPYSRRKDSTQNKTGKMSVPEPTSFSKFVVILAMHICRKILIVDVFWKTGLYVCGVTVISLFTDLFPMPPTYFANKKNPLNMYLVKWGWAWTCSILAVFIYLTSETYCIGNRSVMYKKHMSRLGFGTFWWFFSVQFMNFIEFITGYCDSGLQEHTDKQSCISAGHFWISWDPSGHTFLLIYCLLIIAEELKCFASWDMISEVIENKNNKPSWEMTEKDNEKLNRIYTQNTPFIRCVVVVIAVLQIIWEVMLLATAVYFHNMPSKLFGAVLAIIGWLLSYQGLYKLDNATPCLPGLGRVKYIKEM